MTEVNLVVDVTDDYGLLESGIVFQLGDEEEFVLSDWKLETAEGESQIEASATRRQRLAEVLPLESFGLGQFDFISYYAYAVDNREGNSLRSESDLRYIDIRPLRQYYQSMQGGGGEGGGGGFRTSVDEIIRRQRRLINQTRKLIRSNSAGLEIASQLGSVDSIVSTQSELAGFVRFLISQLQERGLNDNLDAFNVAESSMLLAADSLAVGELELAQTQQREAMRALVEANDELERLLGQLNQAERQALRNTQRELERLLNLATDESDQRLASELRALASRQDKLGDQSKELEKSVAELTESADDQELRDKVAEQVENAAMEQIKIQERLIEISESISEQVSASELVVSLFRENMDRLDRLVANLHATEFDVYRDSSDITVESLEELALLIESIAPTETPSRIAKLRDLIASLAQIEEERANEISKLAQQTDPNSNSDSATTLSRLNSALKARTDTISEAFKSIDSLPDGGEGAQRVRQLLEDSQFLDLLDQASQDSESDGTSEAEAGSRIEDTRTRAEEIRSVAMQLEDLYRELVAPQLEKLRELERLASETQRSIQQAGSPTSDDVAAMQQLASELNALGLSKLSEMLADPQGVSPEQIGKLTKLLRAKIQELVFLETGAEEQSAVPPRYEELIDLYFRALSGDA